MYTGTLIEGLIAAIEWSEAQARDLKIHKVWDETGVEDNDTEVVPTGTLNAHYDLTVQLDAQQQTIRAISSVHSAHSTTQFVSLLLKTSRWLVPTCGQCPLVPRISLGTAVRLRCQFNDFQLS